MKTYAMRKRLRTPARCQFCYFCNGTLATGIVWDLSETGWRAAGERPVCVGTESTVYITLHDGNQSHNIIVDTAVVRWSDGHVAGWEITRMDEASRARLMDFLEQLKSAVRPSEVMTGSHC
ncbi:MAG: hypothetical protein A4E19_09235 [Nitrospira sp. SG-bin1]|nr:MAG: hypothetical protein A4E19_09235 [Nitrospira sp. SG-bin1]